MTGPREPEIDISVSCRLWEEALPDARALSRNAAQAVLRARGWAQVRAHGPDLAHVEAGIVLADDAFVRGLNRDYRDRDRPTNVLSFPVQEPDQEIPARGETLTGMPVMLGDVVVAYETAAAEAIEEGKTLGDHLCHLVVHGMLHLLGHDHQTPAAAEAMEKLEVDVLAGLDIANPYGDGHPAVN
ncbi:MAG: rRNA maturation RNase YbeY [Rhodospirillaceae bacterium]|nr:rRNA maturation RNase YbeY [Rhodospirillaceae bacterium]